MPVVYSLAKQTSIKLSFTDGTSSTIADNGIDPDVSMQIFDKKGTVTKIEVALKPGLE